MTRPVDAADAVDRVLEGARRAGAHSADAFALEEDALEARVRGEEIDFVKHARERSLTLRVFAEGSGGLSSAITSTSDLSPDALTRLVDDTCALARATAPDPTAGLPEGGFATDAPDLGLADEADRTVAVEARVDDARRAERAARETDPRVVNSEGSEAGSGFRRLTCGNSTGWRGGYVSASHALSCMPIARENGGGMQTDYWYTAARTLAGLEDPARVGRTAAERAVRRLGARRVRTQEVPVIFEPRTARSLLGHLAACVSGGAVYRETSCLAGRRGDVVASERVTVVDDGRRPGGLGSRPFDGEGQPTRRNVILRDGRLETYLLDTYTARKLGLASTGSAGRAPGGGPAPGTSNLWLEPGDRSPESILAGTRRGLLVTWLFGHGFNPVTGDLSRGAAGVWIEDGEPRFPTSSGSAARERPRCAWSG